MNGLTTEQFYALIAIAVFCFIRLGWGLYAGSVGFFLKKCEREESPIRFWLDMATCTICGVIAAGAAVCARIPSLAHYAADVMRFIDRMMSHH